MKQAYEMLTVSVIEVQEDDVIRTSPIDNGFFGPDHEF